MRASMAAIIAALASSPGFATQGAPMSASPIVFFDIAGPDMAKLRSFYADNFGWDVSAAGAIVTPHLAGTLRQDPPEKILYLGVADLDSSIAKVKASGGTIETPKLPTPTGETFVVFRDPAGNRMGMVQAK